MNLFTLQLYSLVHAILDESVLNHTIEPDRQFVFAHHIPLKEDVPQLNQIIDMQTIELVHLPFVKTGLGKQLIDEISKHICKFCPFGLLIMALIFVTIRIQGKQNLFQLAVVDEAIYFMTVILHLILF